MIKGQKDKRTKGQKEKRKKGQMDNRHKKCKRTKGQKDKRAKGQKDKRPKGQKDKGIKGQKDKRIFLKKIFEVLCCILGTCTFLFSNDHLVPRPRREQTLCFHAGKIKSSPCQS